LHADSRRRLRRPSGFRFAIAESISHLNPGHWDTLVHMGASELSSGRTLGPQVAD